MIDSVAADFESLDYATKTARAVLDTLVLISSENETLGIDSQVFVCLGGLMCGACFASELGQRSSLQELSACIV